MTSKQKADYPAHDFVLKFMPIAILVTSLMMPHRSDAQLQMGANAGYLVTKKTATFPDNGYLNIGLMARRFFTHRIALASKLRYSDRGRDLGPFIKSDRLFILGPELDYFFNRGAVQPYVGAELNWFHGVDVEESPYGNIYKNKSNYALGPKLGIQWTPRKAFGFEAQAGYQFPFANKVVDNTFILSLGAFFSVGRHK